MNHGDLKGNYTFNITAIINLTYLPIYAISSPKAYQTDKHSSFVQEEIAYDRDHQRYAVSIGPKRISSRQGR